MSDFLLGYWSVGGQRQLDKVSQALNIGQQQWSTRNQMGQPMTVWSAVPKTERVSQTSWSVVPKTEQGQPDSLVRGAHMGVLNRLMNP